MNQVKDLAEELNINKTTLQKIFQQEIMTQKTKPTVTQ
jgi:predicted transcriptional regulator